MPAPSPLPFVRKRWLQVSLGLVAGGLATLLAFNVGTDLARTVWSGPAAANNTGQSARVADAVPTPAQTPAPVQAPVPAPPPADAPFVVKSILPIPGPIKFGQFFWDESKGEPGPVVITVDLTARVLSVFRNGHEIGATAILKGYGDKPTPLGVFPITQKDKDHVSSLYDAPMPYMMRLTNDGVSIHGSKVEIGYATNGCVGVPNEFAKRLFGVASLGDKVIITDGKRMGVGDPIIAPGSPPKS